MAKGGNVFVERLWESVKYQKIYRYACDTVFDGREALPRYFDFSVFNT
jgi:hypothetical protein